MPPKNDTIVHVSEKTIAAFGVSGPTQPTQDEQNTGFPSGDKGILSLLIRWAGTFNTSGASGSAVTDGALKILRSIRFHTDKHGDIIKGVPALFMHRMLQMAHGTRQTVVDCASSADGTTFRAALRIPFADPKRMKRPYDGVVDVKKAIPDLKLQFGQVTDIQSGGTAATVNGLRRDISCEVVEGLSADPKSDELPHGIPRWEQLAPVAASAGSVTIPIPTGDRLVRRIHLAQVTVDPTSGLVTEVSSIIPTTSKLTLKVDTDLIVDGVTYGELNDKNKDEGEQIESMPAGWAFMDFEKDKTIQKMLNLYDYQAGVVSNIYIDSINTVSNGFIYPLMEYFQKVPPEADRTVA